MIRVCFVCLGNICRSPTAEGVMRHLVEVRGLSSHIVVDSAGTAAVHAGEPPDERSVAVARQRGISVFGEARQFVAADFARFDYVLALDDANLRELRQRQRSSVKGTLRLLLDFDAESPPGASVPDPYYGGQKGFERVIDLCERACNGLLDHLVESHGLRSGSGGG